MTRRDELKAENRAKLIAASRKVFAEKGLAVATARDIVRETDLATGTFYNYFVDKEDAFAAVLDEFARRARAAAREERLQPGVGIEDRVFNAYRAYFRLVVEDPQMFEVLRRNADAIAVRGDAELFGAGIRELVEDMRQWVEEGLLPSGVSAELPLVAAAIAGGGFQIATMLAEEGRSDVDAVARVCTRMLLGGIRSLG